MSVTGLVQAGDKIAAIGGTIAINRAFLAALWGTIAIKADALAIKKTVMQGDSVLESKEMQLNDLCVDG